jgi:hypothetical protein
VHSEEVEIVRYRCLTQRSSPIGEESKMGRVTTIGESDLRKHTECGEATHRVVIHEHHTLTRCPQEEKVPYRAGGKEIRVVATNREANDIFGQSRGE